MEVRREGKEMRAARKRPIGHRSRVMRTARALRRRVMAAPPATSATRRLKGLGGELRRLTWPPTLQFIGVLILLLIATGFVLTYVFGSPWWHESDQTCKRNDLGCGLVIHLIGTGIVAALAFYVLFLGRETYAAIRWRWRAKRKPEAIFPHLPPPRGLTGEAGRKPLPRGWRAALRLRRPDRVRTLRSGSARSIVDNVISRTTLVEELANDLEAGGSPQILVGPTGSGKTMVLLKLVQKLAQKHQVPVAISLRDTPKLDFEEQARKAYREAFPNHTDEQADKQWRWHRRSGLITILIDDVEKATQPQQAVVEALARTTRGGLRVTAASRPTGLPGGFKQGRVDLDSLNEQEVRKALTKRAKAASPNGIDIRAERVIEAIAKDSAILRTPYYLAISNVLADTGTLAHLELPSDRDVRLVLLDAYRADVKAGRSRGDSGLDQEARERVLDGLEPIALISLSHRGSPEEIATGVRELGVSLDAAEIVDYGKRLGILEPRYDAVRFGHPTTLAYFAARFLANRKHDRELWETTLKVVKLGSTTSLALELANAAVSDTAIAQMTCVRLLDRLDKATSDVNRLEEMNPNQRLVVLYTVAEIAQKNGAWGGDLADRIVDAAAKEPNRAGLPPEQARLVKQIAKVPSPKAYESLWKFSTTAPDYLVRRVAMGELLHGRGDAVESGLDHMQKVMREAGEFCQEHALPVDGDRDPLFEKLRAVAWMLPGLLAVCDDTGYTAAAAELRGFQERLNGYANDLTRQRGLEASIADGLKQDALRDARRPPDELAVTMLKPGGDRAKFWFSRVLLVQAVARRCVSRADVVDARKRVLAARKDEHPLVREAARLCAQALRPRPWDREHWRHYIWEDMTQVAAGGDSGLSRETKQLIGEIVIALNMNEHASDKMRARFGIASALPACLELSRNRAEILGLSGPVEGCPFEDGGKCLCPYPYHPPKHGIRRELSRAFCRDQRLHAQRLRHSDIHVNALKDFWRGMESLARF